MRWAVVLAIGSVAATLAGCAFPGAVPTMSFSEAYSVAWKDVRSWDRDARLVAGTGTENSPAAIAEAEEDLQEAERELSATPGAERPSPLGFRVKVALLRAEVEAGAEPLGDGRAALWAFRFVGHGNDTRDVYVSQGRIVWAGEGVDGLGIDSFASLPVEPFEGVIGSEEMAKVARSQEGMTDALAQAESSFEILLQGASDRPFWILGAEAADGEDSAFAAVDAGNGTLVPEDRLLADVFGFVLSETGSQRGTLTAQAPAHAEASFSLAQQHGQLAVATWIRPPPPAPVAFHATLSGPNGTSAEWDVRFEPTPVQGVDAMGSTVLDDPPVGEYRLDLDGTLAVQDEWTVAWCTDGFGLSVPLPLSPGPPCYLLGG